MHRYFVIPMIVVNMFILRKYLLKFNYKLNKYQKYLFNKIYLLIIDLKIFIKETSIIFNRKILTIDCAR